MPQSDPFLDRTPSYVKPSNQREWSPRVPVSNYSRHFQPLWHGQGMVNREPVTPVQHDFPDVDLMEQGDIQLDAFDRELLEEQTQSRQWRAKNGTARLSLSSQTVPATFRGESSNAFRDDNGAVLTQCGPNLFQSYKNPFSSPTISVLQKRQNSIPHREDAQEKTSTFATQNHDLISARSLHSERSIAYETPIIQGIQLVATTTLSDQLRSMFKFPLFNAVQSKCFPCAFNSNDNLVVSAPTGSGKTVIMELAICRLMESLKTGDIKIVYQAPTKALCNERYRDWQAKFGPMDVNCTELTGDTEFTSLRNVATASIIITTPEKWDSVTRKWKDNARLMQLIKLFLIDEVHILKDTRGATLEAIVSRMKSVGSGIRFIALSATIPNSNDIATWLTRNSSSSPNIPAHCEVFGESFRPVQLETHIKAFQGAGNPWGFEKMLTDKIFDIIKQYSKRKPVMIFCATKDSASRTAQALASTFNEMSQPFRPWDPPKRLIGVEDENLRKTLLEGVAFHHGGVSASDRQVVERSFLDGDVSIICSTSTLAVGVNLPCYLVILKGTSGYTDSGLKEYSRQEITQMLGRAGRPQFETEARAVIMCRTEFQKKYERLLSGQEVLESSLHLNTIEHLNAEIGIGTVHDIASAKQWLMGTFLAVRMRQNPGYYRLTENSCSNSAEDILINLCEKDLSLLQNSDLVKQSGRLKCTPYGEAMAQYYVKFETMKTFMALPEKARISEILQTLCEAEELHELRPKAGEKSFLKEINKGNDIKFPTKTDITLPAHKASVLIQSRLGGITFDKLIGGKNKLNMSQIRQLQMDTNVAIGHCKRLIRCLVDMQLHRDDSIAAKNALELGRGLAAGVWDDSPLQLKQIAGIGEVFARKFASAGIKSLEALFQVEPQRIEFLLSKNPPFGSNIAKKVADFPVLRVTAKEMGKKATTSGEVELKLRCEIGFLNDIPSLRFNGRQYSVLFLCETSNGKIVDFRRFSPMKLQNGEEIFLTAVLQQPTNHINCHVMCDDVAGTHRYAELKVNVQRSCFLPSYTCNPEAERPELAKNCREAVSNLEEFDSDGLDDSDLLAVLNDGHAEEIVEDIDEIMDSVKNCKAQQRESHQHGPETLCTAKGSDNDAHPTDFREPEQLENGRWTCQHHCNDKGIVCKHKCCKEGVERPKKRPKRAECSAKVNNAAPKLPKLSADKVKAVNGQSRLLQEFLIQKSKVKSGDNILQQDSGRELLDNDLTITRSPLPVSKNLEPHQSSNSIASVPVHEAYIQSSHNGVNERSSASEPEDWDAIDMDWLDSNQKRLGQHRTDQTLAPDGSNTGIAVMVGQHIFDGKNDVDDLNILRTHVNTIDGQRSHERIHSTPGNHYRNEGVPLDASKRVPAEFGDLSDLEDVHLPDLDQQSTAVGSCQHTRSVPDDSIKIETIKDDGEEANLQNSSARTSISASKSWELTMLEKAKKREDEKLKKKEIYEENQKRKWAEINSEWLTYENCGRFAELV